MKYRTRLRTSDPRAGSPSLGPVAQVERTRDPGPGESRIIPGPSQVPLGPRHLIKFVRFGYLHSRRGASGGASRGTGAHKQRCNRGVHCRITSGIEIGLKKAFSMFSRFFGAFFALKNLFVRNRPRTQVSQVPQRPGTQARWCERTRGDIPGGHISPPPCP